MHGKTYVGDGVDYALLFDDGRVALYFRGGANNARLVDTMAAAVELVGELKPYLRGPNGLPVLRHRYGQAFPLELEIDDRALELLAERNPKPQPSARERLAELDAERNRILAELVGDAPAELHPVGPAVIAAAAEVDAAAAKADELEPVEPHEGHLRRKR